MSDCAGTGFGQDFLHIIEHHFFAAAAERCELLKTAWTSTASFFCWARRFFYAEQQPGQVGCQLFDEAVEAWSCAAWEGC